MLSTTDFYSRVGRNLNNQDDGLIDIVFEGIEVNGEPILDIFYACGAFDSYKIDYGGGVYAITCRDVLTHTESDALKLRDALNLRNTKQNRELCEELIEACEAEIRNAGYIF